MRLTLRTLLAYLDDTLEPAQAKLIGQKVAESDAAQELMARIKQVTRRRRLTTPPSGPGAKTDPNLVAEYLDNMLPAEQLAEIEETCLTSDVHLAEIAACHQILTLVLGEPALVPPTSRQRMYGLVKGPEAIPFRKVPAAGEAALDGAAEEGQEVDETLRLGLPAYRHRGSWGQRLALVAGGLALLGLLALAIWQALLPDTRSTAARDDHQRGEQAGRDANTNVGPSRDKDKTGKTDDRGVRDGKRPDKPSADRPLRDRDTTDKGRVVTDQNPKTRDGGKNNKDRPSTDTAQKDKGVKVKPPVEGELREVAEYLPPEPRDPSSILLRRGPGEEHWQRLKAMRRDVSTGDTLVSLPGYRSEVRFKSGLTLHLLGDLPELYLFSLVLESVVTVHDPRDFDADLTLDHGRIVLTNDKEQPAKIRVRFANPTRNTGTDSWEITLLKKGASVGLELWGRYPPEVPFTLDKKKHLGPQTELYLFVLKGQAHVKIEDTTHGMEEPSLADRGKEDSARPSMIFWNSRHGMSDPKRIKALPPWVAPYPPFPANFSKQDQESLQRLRSDMVTALNELSTSMSGDRVEVGLLAGLRSRNPIKRVLVVRCFGALGDLDNLLDGLVDPKYPDVRRAAIEDLRHWIALNPDNEYKLFDFLREKKGYPRNEAKAVLELLHSYSDAARAQPATYARLIDYLRQENPAIRVLAHWHLFGMVPQGGAIPYDPLGDSAIIERGADQWKKLIPEGSMPKLPKKSTKP